MIMGVRYVCSLFTVSDLQKSKKFYQDVLSQEIEVDLGENISFKGGFAIHDREHFQEIINKNIDNTDVQNGVELYFESDDLDSIQNKLESLNSVFVHKIREQPWGQRVMRFYDPDGYLIEIGESMNMVINRYYQEGMSAKEISERTIMPMEIVKMILSKLN
jgi:catechol 2,3-dioxygenase-like lactoylglutathione lyase family enzyme